jgi:Na+-driven multidrug efflux pump
MMLAGTLYCLVGIGGVLLAALGIVTLADGFDREAMEINEDEILVMMSVGLALAFFCLTGGPLVLYGGYKLRSLRGAGWVKASVIASLVLGCVALLLCMIVGVPFVLLGVWGMVTLNDPDVKTALAQPDADPAAA